MFQFGAIAFSEASLTYAVCCTVRTCGTGIEVSVLCRSRRSWLIYLLTLIFPPDLIIFDSLTVQKSTKCPKSDVLHWLVALIPEVRNGPVPDTKNHECVAAAILSAAEFLPYLTEPSMKRKVMALKSVCSREENEKHLWEVCEKLSWQNRLAISLQYQGKIGMQ